MVIQIQVRRDTAANWTSNNPTLAIGEPGFETDTGKLKIGDGSTAWTGLSYIQGIGLGNIVEDLTPQLGGDLDLNAKGITEELTAAVSLVAGDLCYMNSAGKMDKADASAEATCDTLIGMCLDTIAGDATGSFLLFGRWTTTGLTAGANYYVSLVAGGITTTAPSGTGEIVRIVGTAISTTVLFFNPDRTYLEIT